MESIKIKIHRKTAIQKTRNQEETKKMNSSDINETIRLIELLTALRDPYLKDAIRCRSPEDEREYQYEFLPVPTKLIPDPKPILAEWTVPKVEDVKQKFKNPDTGAVVWLSAKEADLADYIIGTLQIIQGDNPVYDALVLPNGEKALLSARMLAMMDLSIRWFQQKNPKVYKILFSDITIRFQCGSCAETSSLKDMFEAAHITLEEFNQWPYC
jgi:hypothetical protein